MRERKDLAIFCCTLDLLSLEMVKPLLCHVILNLVFNCTSKIAIFQLIDKSSIFIQILLQSCFNVTASLLRFHRRFVTVEAKWRSYDVIYCRGKFGSYFPRYRVDSVTKLLSSLVGPEIFRWSNCTTAFGNMHPR